MLFSVFLSAPFGSLLKGHLLVMHLLLLAPHNELIFTSCSSAPYPNCRNLVPFSLDERSSEAFEDFLLVPAESEHPHGKESLESALDTYAWIIDQLAEQCSDVAHASCSLPSSSSSSSPTGQLSANETSLPFSSDKWCERMRASAQRAQSWLNGDPISDPHRPHCAPVSSFHS